MIKILFVCMGNICRSPAAEGIMKKLAEEAGLGEEVIIDSAGTLDYHAGELPDDRMRRHAAARGYVLESRARQFNPESDFEKFDYILTMDDQNFEVINEWDRHKKYSSKIIKIREFSSDKSLREVPDPYYGGVRGFNKVLDILEDATQNLLYKIKPEIGRIKQK